MQLNGSCVSSGSVADEVPNPDLLQREPESVNVGTLAENAHPIARRAVQAIRRNFDRAKCILLNSRCCCHGDIR